MSGKEATQGLEDTNDDDDLQFLNDFIPSPGTASNVDCSGRTDKGKRKGDENDKSENTDNREPKKSKSDVWNYLERVGKVDGVEKCRCKQCKKLLTCKVESGTTHLRRHVEKCFKSPKYHDVNALLDNQANLLKRWKFDSKAYREGVARAIIKHDLPFSYVEYDGVNELNKLLNPDFESHCRNTAQADCLKVYEREKQKLKSLLVAHSGRICLTSDCWSVVTNEGYMCVTAHYIDSSWKLNCKLFAFVELDAPHSGLELSTKLLEVLKEWGIESKIFSLTLDNASSNDTMVRILRERLNLQGSLLCRGEFFHVRCSTHILNLIVQEGLKVVEDALRKIRNSVKYVKASDGRKRQFYDCIEEVNLSSFGGGFLSLDVSTRWNSTYLMLQSAIKYRRAFTCLSYNDTSYKHCPTNEEWERGERIASFLAPFYKITSLISGSSYPTSNLYFRQISSIEMKLNDFLNSDDEIIKDMARKMKVKFDKYWDSYYNTLAFGSILDPKGKINYLTFVYKELYPCEYEEKVKRVKDSLYELFAEYDRLGIGAKGNTTLRGCSSSITLSHEDMDEFEQQFVQESSILGKSELDIYLDQTPEPLTAGNHYDIIDYWKKNSSRFPRLSAMACDILSIPITTVASESTFSTGGKILTKYRNCLLGKNVQALICCRNWLHDFEDSGKPDEEKVEVIKLSNEDSNVVDVSV